MCAQIWHIAGDIATLSCSVIMVSRDTTLYSYVSCIISFKGSILYMLVQKATGEHLLTFINLTAVSFMLFCSYSIIPILNANGPGEYRYMRLLGVTWFWTRLFDASRLGSVFAILSCHLLKKSNISSKSKLTSGCQKKTNTLPWRWKISPSDDTSKLHARFHLGCEKSRWSSKGIGSRCKSWLSFTYV